MWSRARWLQLVGGGWLRLSAAGAVRRKVLCATRRARLNRRWPDPRDHCERRQTAVAVPEEPA
ncbi:hypothetical protein GCM10028814_14840 [Angustibacter aerolatus]